MTAITSERNATSMRPNANRRTKATTSGSFDFISSAWSFHAAVSPVTPASAFGRAPTVCGTISSRSAARDAFDAASVPLPSIGTVMFATVASSLTSTVIGSCMRPLASARCSSWSIASRTAGAFTSGALTTTLAGQRRAGERLLHPVVGLDDGEGLRERVRSRRGRCAAAAPARRAPAARRRRGPPTARAGAGRGRRSRPRSGLRRRRGGAGRGTGRAAGRPCRRASRAAAGRTVSEPSTATATTRIVATPKEAKVASPVRNMPAIATITVRPEMSTERPEVAAAASSAARSLRPAARSSRSRFR